MVVFIILNENHLQKFLDYHDFAFMSSSGFRVVLDHCATISAGDQTLAQVEFVDQPQHQIFSTIDQKTNKVPTKSTRMCIKMPLAVHCHLVSWGVQSSRTVTVKILLSLQYANIIYDVIPPSLVTAAITEVGVIPSTSVATILTENDIKNKNYFDAR